MGVLTFLEFRSTKKDNSIVRNAEFIGLTYGQERGVSLSHPAGWLFLL